jgi:hypothetical protein
MNTPLSRVVRAFGGPAMSRPVGVAGAATRHDVVTQAAARLKAGRVQQSRPGAVTAAVPDQDAVDAVAGSEFVDDRLRIRE